MTSVNLIDVVPVNPASNGASPGGAGADITEIEDGPDLLMVAPAEDVGGDGAPVGPPEGATEIGTLDGYSDAVVYEHEGEYYVMFNNAEDGPVTLNAEDLARLEQDARNGDEGAADYLESLGATDEELASYGDADAGDVDGDPEEVTTGTTDDDHGLSGDGAEGPQTDGNERTRRSRDEDGVPDEPTTGPEAESVDEPDDDVGTDATSAAVDPDTDPSGPEIQHYAYENGTTLQVNQREDGWTEYTVIKDGLTYYQGGDAQEAMNTVSYHAGGTVHDPSTSTPPPPVDSPELWAPGGAAVSDVPVVPSQVPIGTPRGDGRPLAANPQPGTVPTETVSGDVGPEAGQMAQQGTTTDASDTTTVTTVAGSAIPGVQGTVDATPQAHSSDGRSDSSAEDSLVSSEIRYEGDGKYELTVISEFGTESEARDRASEVNARRDGSTAEVTAYDDGNGGTRWVVKEHHTGMDFKEATGVAAERSAALQGTAPSATSYDGFMSSDIDTTNVTGADEADGGWYRPEAGGNDVVQSENSTAVPTSHVITHQHTFIEDGQHHTTTVTDFRTEEEAIRYQQASADPNAAVRRVGQGQDGHYQVIETHSFESEDQASAHASHQAYLARRSEYVPNGFVLLEATEHGFDHTGAKHYRYVHKDDVQSTLDGGGWKVAEDQSATPEQDSGYSLVSIDYTDDDAGASIDVFSTAASSNSSWPSEKLEF